MTHNAHNKYNFQCYEEYMLFTDEHLFQNNIFVNISKQDLWFTVGLRLPAFNFNTAPSSADISLHFFL